MFQPEAVGWGGAVKFREFHLWLKPFPDWHKLEISGDRVTKRVNTVSDGQRSQATTEDLKPFLSS